MKGRALFLAVLLVPGVALAQLDAYPKTTLAEDATATWCTYCPQAYQGLNVVHSEYDWSEFISARYYATSGDYGTAETDAAIAYYGVGGFPTVIFNGTQRVVGGGSLVASGSPYRAIVKGAYFTPAPIRVEIDSLDLVTGAIQATVTMFSATDSLVNDHIRFVLMEDAVTATHTHVTRDIVNDTISLSGQGSTATFNESFVISPSWNINQLHAVVFVQRNDFEVVQAVSSYTVPDYRVRAMVPFERMKLGPSTGIYTSDLFSVYNTGLSDAFTIALVVDYAPPGWFATYCDQQGQCHVDPMTFPLGQDQSAGFDVSVMPAGRGYMKYHFEVTSPNLSSPLVIPFYYTTDDVDVLVVDDDGDESYEDYFTSALTTVGLTYGLWDRPSAKLTSEAGEDFHFLVWNVGAAYPTLDPDDRAFLRTYLDDGRHLFVTGQDIGWELCTSNSGNYDVAFYHDYLHANYIRDDTNIYYLDGIAGDPVSDGLTLHIAGGDGANNQEYPSEIAPRDAQAVGIFRYQGDGIGAIRAVGTTSGARLVYLAFGFEAIDNPTDRGALMDAAMGYLQQRIFKDRFETGDTSEWSMAVP